MARAFPLLLALLWLAPTAAHAFDMTNQMNVNVGADMPSSGASHPANSGMLKFQIQTPPKFFRFISSFSAVMGSGRKMGEFGAGFNLYFMGKLLEETRIQPFVGAEGIGAFGSWANKMAITGGFGAFTGVDLRIFGKKAGTTLAIEYTQVGQQSLRIWLGVFVLHL